MAPNIRHRILIIDDNEAIHRDFDVVLATKDEADPQLDELEAQVFGDSKPGEDEGAPSESYSLDFALQGQEGLAKVQAAVAAGSPYSLAFVDMRMPPGWDGLITIEHLWQADPALPVVICSAYSDYSWSEIDKRLGHTDQLMTVKKPFDTDGIRQIASHLTRQWATHRRDRESHDELQRLVEDRTREIESVRLAAERAERAKTEFLSNVNHEVREPMTVILGYAELLLANEGMTLEVSEQIEGLSMIKQNGERLLEIINEFLDLTKIDGGRMELAAVEYSPTSLVTAVVHQLRSKADEKELGLTVEITGELPEVVLWDPDRVRQVLSIVLANASDLRATVRFGCAFAGYRTSTVSTPLASRSSIPEWGSRRASWRSCSSPSPAAPLPPTAAMAAPASVSHW